LEKRISFFKIAYKNPENKSINYYELKKDQMNFSIEIECDHNYTNCYFERKLKQINENLSESELLDTRRYYQLLLRDKILFIENNKKTYIKGIK